MPVVYFPHCISYKQEIHFHAYDENLHIERNTKYFYYIFKIILSGKIFSNFKNYWMVEKIINTRDVKTDFKYLVQIPVILLHASF